jgi:acyl dehydratase
VTAVGDELPALTVQVTRQDLVRYAGAALDFNPIHWNEPFAKEVGLPDVIAHGMLTMAFAGRVITDWTGSPAGILEYYVRFTRPVVVPNDDKGATIELSGKVREINEDGTAKVDITAKFDGKSILGKAQARLKLSA